MSGGGGDKEAEMRSPAESDDDNMSVQESDDDDNDYQVWTIYEYDRRCGDRCGRLWVDIDEI